MELYEPEPITQTLITYNVVLMFLCCVHVGSGRAKSGSPEALWTVNCMVILRVQLIIVIQLPYIGSQLIFVLFLENYLSPVGAGHPFSAHSLA